MERIHVGGRRITGADDGPAYLVVVVSAGFDGVPWLERVRQAQALWDAAELGAPTEVHCYTPVEVERKRATVPAVRQAVVEGLELEA